MGGKPSLIASQAGFRLFISLKSKIPIIDTADNKLAVFFSISLLLVTECNVVAFNYSISAVKSVEEGLCEVYEFKQ